MARTTTSAATAPRRSTRTRRPARAHFAIRAIRNANPKGYRPPVGTSVFSRIFSF